MSGAPTFVCPNTPAILSQLQGRSVIVTVEKDEAVPLAFANARTCKVALRGLWVKEAVPLVDMQFWDALEDVPVALTVPTAGDLTKTIRLAPLLRKLKTRIFIPVDTAENIRALRILSSLGIQTGANLTGAFIAWESLTDLMTYALLGMAAHADIEPFASVSKTYVPGQRLDFAAGFIADSAKYLHVDDYGNVARTRDDLDSKIFLPPGMLDKNKDTELTKVCQKDGRAWRDDFAKANKCAFCEGYKLCLGKFKSARSMGGTCEDFFSELMSVVERHQATTRIVKRIEWPQ